MKKEILRLLELRKQFYADKAEMLLLSKDYDNDEFQDANFMYGRYIDVIADIRDYLKDE